MTRPRAEPRCLALALAAFAVAAQGQQGTTVQASVGVMQTWTDNLRLAEDGSKDAALITTVSPGVRIVSNSGAVRGNLDYSLNGIAYVKSDQASRVQNALSATGQAELIPRMLFVDARATIGQQNASAFGAQSAPAASSQGSVSSLANPNQRETGTLTLSPSLRGQLGGVASYELRGDFSRTEVRGSSVGDSRSHGGSLRVSEANAGVLGWWVTATSQDVTASSAAASNSNEMLKLGVDYRPDVDWTFTLNGGRERNNYLSGTSQDGSTGGVSSQWTPTERTLISADWQYHNYGNSHGFNFSHRMAHSVWRLSDTVGTTLGNTGSSGGVRTNYDLYYQLFASPKLSPVELDALVRAYLQSQNLSPDALVSSGFLSTGPSRVHNQQLAITLQGVRSTLSALVSRTVTSRLGSNSYQGTLADTSHVEQMSYSLTASHQLTPVSALSLSLSRQNSKGDAASQSTRLTTLIAGWNSRLAERLSVLLGARHSQMAGVTAYTENSVYASLTQQF